MEQQLVAGFQCFVIDHEWSPVAEATGSAVGVDSTPDHPALADDDAAEMAGGRHVDR